MKKVLAYLMTVLPLCLLLCILPVSANAATSGSCGENITWYYDASTKTLSITGSGDMVFDGDSAPWGEARYNSRHVYISEGITSIADNAFSRFAAVNEIVLPSTITKIGNNAFNDCSVQSVTIPHGVTSIGEWAFARSEGLANITIPGSVKTIGPYAFYYCQGLTQLTLMDGVSSIGGSAFSWCTGLTNVSIPDSVTSMGDGVFSSCDALYSAKLSGGVAEISNDTFQGCDNLTAVTIPYGVIRIGEGAFGSCKNLTNIALPDSLTRIDAQAFSDCEGLTYINLPANVTQIGAGAFQGTGLTSAYIPYGFTSVPASIFEGCHNLTSVWLPDTVTVIEPRAFYLCNRLTSVVLPSNLVEIGQSAFESSAVADIQIPATVMTIGDGAFCSTKLQNVTIPYGVTRIGNSTFMNCVNLTSVAIPDTVTSIGSSAFYNCGSLQNLTIPPYVKSIEAGTISMCVNLSHIIFTGHAPEFTDYCLHHGGASALQLYYPAADITWADTVTQNYGGNVVWLPSEYLPVYHTYMGGFCTECGVEEPPFSDIAHGAYYYDAVKWAVEKKITTGMTDTTFVPDGTCTRAQVVTFLWRANGSPAPTSSNNPFADVPAGQWYTDAVLWAVEEGITTGMSETTFAPDASCTRGQVATFLHRAQGKPASSGTNIFTDLEAGAYYYDAVLWAVEKEITNGMGDGTFAPDATCTRGQIVTFLFRALA